MTKFCLVVALLISFFGKLAISSEVKPGTKPKDGFVSISDIDSTIVVETRYYGDHNFVGTPIRGYKAPKCLLTKQAAQALAEVQKELKEFSLFLKVYDCYRPQKAVEHFESWAKKKSDTKMKGEFYLEVDKGELFEKGYIAHRSGHSRGSTVDLTIIPLPIPEQESYAEGQALKDCRLPLVDRFSDNSLDMGTGYDCFSTLANTANPTIGHQQRANRLLLKMIMERHDFTNYDKEWWHFTLKEEPYPDTFFDFEVK